MLSFSIRHRQFLLLVSMAVILACAATSTRAQAQADLRRCWNSRLSPYEAIGYCNRALESNEITVEERAATYSNRGMMKFRLSNYEGAIEDFNASLFILPGSTLTLVNRAKTHARMRDAKRAIADYDAALRIEPENVEYLMDRGGQLRGMREFELAMTDFDTVLRLSPGSARARIDRAVNLRRKGDYAGALAAFDAMRQANPRDGSAIYQQGVTNFGRFAAAERDFTEADRIFGDPYTALWVYIGKARTGADWSAQLAATIKPNVDNWYSSLADYYLGNRQEVTLQLEARISDKSGRSEAQKLCDLPFYLGLRQVLLKHGEQARALLTKAQEMCGPDSDEYDMAGVELKRLRP